MTPRLLKIVEFVPGNASVIDVGTDHAYVPIHLVKEKKAIKALATDVNDGPLRRAAENIKSNGLCSEIQTLKANGLAGVDSTGYDTVVIAGMGGILISEILSDFKNRGDKVFILQPMTAVMELRSFLVDNGFSIMEEGLVSEEDKLYTVIKAKEGNESPYSASELILGRKTKNDALYPELVKRTKKKLSAKLAGKLRAKNQDTEEIEKIRNLIKEIEL